MRVTTGLLGFGLLIIIFFQSCTSSIGGGVTDNQKLIGAGMLGFIVCVMVFLGSAFSFGVPRLSMYIFLFVGILAFLGGQISLYTDLKIHGYFCFILATTSYFSINSSSLAGKQKDPLVLLDELESLSRLYKSGTFNDEEFLKEKSKLLKKI